MSILPESLRWLWKKKIKVERNKKMIKYIFKRLLMCIPIVIAITFIIFAILSFTPGDPARNKLGNLASKEAVEELREEWGLNDPFLVRYVNYMKGLLHGDMGRSYKRYCCGRGS